MYLVADTGFWYGLFDPRDDFASDARARAEYLERLQVVLPWPILYETISTRFARNRAALAGFEAFLKRPGISYLDDIPYRESALEFAFESSLRASRPLSLTDCTIRMILDDVKIRISYFITFNEGDFGDVCRRRQIELIGRAGT